jgi:hypothetical protein
MFRGSAEAKTALARITGKTVDDSVALSFEPTTF